MAEQEGVYISFCNLFRSEELSQKLKVDLVRATHINPESTLFREIAGRLPGYGAWFSWASTEPLDVAFVRQMADSETKACVFVLSGVPIIGLPASQIRVREEERCTIYLREGYAAPIADSRIIKLQEKHLPMLDTLFGLPEVTQYQRDVYPNAYETIIRSTDTEESKYAVYGLIIDGLLISALQVSTEAYPAIHFKLNRLINPFTRPDRRGQGFGKAVMTYALGLFPGETVIYEYDGENENAAKLANACGFEPNLNIDLYELNL